MLVIHGAFQATDSREHEIHRELDYFGEYMSARGCACRSAILENVLIKELPRPKQVKGLQGLSRAPTGSQGRREGGIH
jgi:hypothetical protein